MEAIKAVYQQVTSETLPWVWDLFAPWFKAVDIPGACAWVAAKHPCTLPDPTFAATRSRRELALEGSHWPGSSFKTIDGVELHYLEIGKPGNGEPTLILWHGFNGSVFNWCVLRRSDALGLRGGRGGRTCWCMRIPLTPAS